VTAGNVRWYAVLAIFLAIVSATIAVAGAAAPDRDAAVPKYDHILVIVEENKSYGTVLNHGYAPTISDLAKTYGMATQMFAERHPSEPNYVALVGGDTFGIADDDAWYCTPGTTREFCKGADAPGFAVHLVDGPNLATQLAAKGLGWRAYLENIPGPGSLAIVSPETDTAPAALYAAKHTGFTNFASVHADPNLARELVGFDALTGDLRSGNVPAFALIVPNQCDEMHGINSPKAPQDCQKGDEGLVTSGDATVHTLIAQIQASPIWAHGNTAVVITWDEDGKGDRVPGAPQSCCVVDAHNPGGGHIPTIVITNHGPRGMNDPTSYDHYSLLRTIEDAFRLDGHLRHAGDASVQAMTPLFALSR
jgi:phosphatidylinositol-3-phosphatase